MLYDLVVDIEDEFIYLRATAQHSIDKLRLGHALLRATGGP